MVPLIVKGIVGMVISRLASTMAIGKMVKATTIGKVMPRRTAALTITIGPVSYRMEDIIETIGTV